MSYPCAYCEAPATKLTYCEKHYKRVWRAQRGLVDLDNHCRTCGRRTKVADVFGGYCYPCYSDVLPPDVLDWRDR